jgi:hypothetical protein
MGMTTWANSVAHSLVTNYKYFFISLVFNDFTRIRIPDPLCSTTILCIGFDESKDVTTVEFVPSHPPPIPLPHSHWKNTVLIV